jgi:purine-binding chemotaxis protein CheW
MGRMSEARKKAKQKAAERPPSEPAKAQPEEAGTSGAAESAPPLEDDASSFLRTEAAREAAANDESMVFPADGAADGELAPGDRFELPPSGLAEDILGGLQGAAALADAVPAAEPAQAPPVATEAPARGHSISFFSSPAREERVAVEETEHLATFFLDREEYGVDVRLVQEIRRVTEITQVPRAPEFIKGVINLRGRIIPVIDLKKKLGLGEVSVTKVSRIVVVTLKGRLLGLLVDGASQVLKVPVSLVEPAPEEVVQKGGDYLRGVAKLEGRLIILIELPTVLKVELSEGTAASA